MFATWIQYWWILNAFPSASVLKFNTFFLLFSAPTERYDHEIVSTTNQNTVFSWIFFGFFFNSLFCRMVNTFPMIGSANGPDNCHDSLYNLRRDHRKYDSEMNTIAWIRNILFELKMWCFIYCESIANDSISTPSSLFYRL